MNWAQLYDVILRFGGWLIQPDPTIPAIPQHATYGAPSPEEEKWADEWSRKFFRKPKLVPPAPRQRYVLVPRFRYARTKASLHAKLNGSEQVPNPAAKWEEFLVQRWRGMWLSSPHIPEGEQNSLQA